jgi:hypothetical protein
MKIIMDVNKYMIMNKNLARLVGVRTALRAMRTPTRRAGAAASLLAQTMWITKSKEKINNKRNNVKCINFCTKLILPKVYQNKK